MLTSFFGIAHFYAGELFDAKSYINNEKNLLRRKLRKRIFKKYGSPLLIGSEIIDYDANELTDLLQKKIEEHKHL